MVLRNVGPLAEGRGPLVLEEVPLPIPGAGDVRVRVAACGVCHTDLDEIEGRLPPSRLPRVLGHQAVGSIDEVGPGGNRSWLGARVGLAWIFRACGTCPFCASGRENLCARFEATGRDVDGGYAEFAVAPVDFVHRIPDTCPDVEAAPLLCAGAIGYRSLRLTELRDGQPLGLTGFGASAHLVLQMARHLFPRSRVFVFARSGEDRAFALELGATWAGDIGEPSPERLEAIIDTTPVWRPVVRALESLAPGGRLVINAIRKDDVDKAELLALDYATHLWMEKVIRSVANVTRDDVRKCLDLAASTPIRPVVTTYPLEAVNEALVQLKRGGARGATVLSIRR